MIENWAPHQLNRLLRRMVVLLFIRRTHDEFRRGRTPDCRILTGLSVPRGIDFPDKPAGLMLEPVEGSCEHGTPLVPYQLLVVHEPNAQEAVENLAREFTGMPHISRLEAGNQRERFRPVGAGVPRNRGLGMTGSTP